MKEKISELENEIKSLTIHLEEKSKAGNEEERVLLIVSSVV